MTEEKTQNNFNFNGPVNQAAAKIDNTNSHIGDVNYYSDSVQMGLNEFYDGVSTALKEQGADELVNEVVAPLLAAASSTNPAEQQKAATEQVPTLFQRVKPYGPKIAACVVAGGVGALKALMSRNPVVAATLAMLEEWRKEDPKSYPPAVQPQPQQTPAFEL